MIINHNSHKTETTPTHEVCRFNESELNALGEVLINPNEVLVQLGKFEERHIQTPDYLKFLTVEGPVLIMSDLHAKETISPYVLDFLNDEIVTRGIKYLPTNGDLFDGTVGAEIALSDPIVESFFRTHRNIIHLNSGNHDRNNVYLRGTPKDMRKETFLDDEQKDFVSSSYQSYIILKQLIGDQVKYHWIEHGDRLERQSSRYRHFPDNNFLNKITKSTESKMKNIFGPNSLDFIPTISRINNLAGSWATKNLKPNTSMIIGHSHSPIIENLSGQRKLINSGSLISTHKHGTAILLDAYGEPHLLRYKKKNDKIWNGAEL